MWTCHVCVWLSCYQWGSFWLGSKPYQCKSMHIFHLVDHWLWLFMAQSNWWQLLPRVQSASLVWVGDHNHGLLIYAFRNLCTSICQCDNTIWGDINVGSTSLVISFHQDVPLLGETIWQYQLPLIQATQFSNWVEWELSFNRWCQQRHHPVVSWHNCLDITCRASSCLSCCCKSQMSA